MDNKDDFLLEEFNKLIQEDTDKSRVSYIVREIKTQKQDMMNSPRKGEQIGMLLLYDSLLNYLERKAG